MLPAQYPRKKTALTVDFLVKPATLLEMRLSIMGNTLAHDAHRMSPTYRPALFVDGS